jgi:predicted SnoaL-like aldol condensation-catalyzing enzyme
LCQQLKIFNLEKLLMAKTNKEKAQDFLILAAQGKSREAFSLYVGEGFRHHNIHFKGDAETLITAMEENAKNNPGLIIEIKRTLHDGELVAVHSYVRQDHDDPGMALIHIFRFESEKIMELWDFGQVVPVETVNENGMF